MCGIIGYVGTKKVAPVLLEGIRRLEYRGYDSIGFAAGTSKGIIVMKDTGKIEEALSKIELSNLEGTAGIAHCRWATSGKVTKENAHPHTSCDGKIALVHNGIVENYAEIKSQLIQAGHEFKSETDTEVIVHLIESYNEGDLKEAVKKTTQELIGSYSIVVISTDRPDTLIVARKESPLVIGIGKDENYVASDVPAVLKHTKDFLFLEENDIAEITPKKITIENNNVPVKRDKTTITWDAKQAEKQGYAHFMLKEIHEQPQAIANTIKGRANGGVQLKEELTGLTRPLNAYSRVIIIACGTSWHAALIGKYLFEEFAKTPVEVDYASEFRYRKPVVGAETLVVAISQSGETADTLAGLREAKKRGADIVGVVNAVGSTIARESNAVLYTHAGPEVGVASTKAFTTQVTMLYLLALQIAAERKVISETRMKDAVEELRKIPLKVEVLLKRNEHVEDLAKDFFHHTNALYLGRGVNYPIALEGALKLKEVSYIHAEGYPAAEMKHGPIALIDKNMPVVFIATQDQSYRKILSNVEEVKARGGHVIAIATDGDEYLKTRVDHVLYIPQTDDLLLPLLTTIPLQLLAYHAAILRKLDPDMPRSLSKSVTVE